MCPNRWQASFMWYLPQKNLNISRDSDKQRLSSPVTQSHFLSMTDPNYRGIYLSYFSFCLLSESLLDLLGTATLRDNA